MARPDGSERERLPSPAVGRALELLEELARSNGEMTLTALAKRVGVPLATCGTSMQTLELRG